MSRSSTFARLALVLVLTFAAACLLGHSAYAQETSTSRWMFENQWAIKQGSATPIMNARMDVAFSGHALGGFGWLQATPYWAQGYAGLTWAPKPWLAASLGAGIEQAEHPWRVGADVWVGTPKLWLLAIGEVGGSGPWYRCLGNWQATDHLGIGAMTQIGEGAGPRAQVSVWRLTAWGAVLARPLAEEDATTLPAVLTPRFGIKAKF